jgi:hypothetical protein
MLLHFIFVVKKQDLENRTWEFEYVVQMAKFYKIWIEKIFSKKIEVQSDQMPVTSSLFHRINIGSLLNDHRKRGEDIYHFYLTYFRPFWTDCTCEGYHAENFSMIWWQPGIKDNISFLAEKNCTVVSHELAHEFLRQSNNKNYVELVHEIWTKHLFAALPFEYYDETFKKTDKIATFSTIDTSEFGL